MRTDQYIGLSPRAIEFIKDVKLQYIGNYEIEGAWNQIPLAIYLGLNYVWVEVEHKTPWSSGPMYFTALKAFDRGTGEPLPKMYYEWTDEEIE